MVHVTRSGRAAWEPIAVAAIVAVGLAARLYEIRYAFDADEAFSVRLASGAWSDVIARSLQDRPHPPLYNVLLHVWLRLWGSTELSARSLSVLCSAAFLVTGYALMRRLVSDWIALGLLLVLAVSPFFVFYGEQARPYGLVAALGAFNLLAFCRLIEEPADRRRLARWAASGGLLVYAQYLGILPIAIEIAVAFVVVPARRLAIAASGLAAALLILVWALPAMGAAILQGRDPVSEISWMGPPTLGSFLSFYVSIFGEGPGVRARWLVPLLALPMAVYARRLIRSRASAEETLLWLAGAGIPLTVYLASAWGPKPLFAPRQLIGAALAFVASVGVCLATVRRSIAGVLLVALIGWTAAALPQAFPHNTRAPWRDIVAGLDRQSAAIPVFAQEPWAAEALNYYKASRPVRLSTDRRDLPETDVFLFACRPTGGCSQLETEAFRARRSLVATWRWGDGRRPLNELRVYRVGPTASASGESGRAASLAAGR